MKHVVSIDQGTTGTTVLVIDERLRIVGRANQEFRQIYPKPGWVEHDLEDIWGSVTGALEGALRAANIDARSIEAIGITNQRETTALWESESLRPARTAIVWQDRRTAELCQQMKDAGHEKQIRNDTGLVLDPYFSGTKLKWMFQADADLAKRARTGALAFGTIDSFVVARLTAGRTHITDVTNASRTLLMDLTSLAWSPRLCELFDVPPEVLPEIRASAEIYGETRGVPGLPDGVPIAGIAGDQQAALFGQACFEPGDAKATYGTGAFILMNTGSEPTPSKHGLLTTVGWKLAAGDEAGEIVYALEGAAFIAGAAVQWLRDGLGFIETAPEVETLAASVPDSGEVIMVPGFVGLGAPHWRPHARGLISGISRGTTRAHIARAALEGIALQNYDILKAMEDDSGRQLKRLKVDGGAAANDLLMQFQADVLNVSIARPEIIETTALGAAFLAGLGAGVWRSKSQIADVWREDRSFVPTTDRIPIEQHLERWNEAVKKA